MTRGLLQYKRSFWSIQIRNVESGTLTITIGSPKFKTSWSAGPVRSQKYVWSKRLQMTNKKK